MPKRTKVLSIAEEKYRLIAMDERSHRIIFAIGGQRFAIDLLSRVSLLPPATGTRQADIVPLKKKETHDDAARNRGLPSNEPFEPRGGQ